ncbi:MAG: MFS transporter [Gammaproteobacteria bacterium]|nr:MFS transporter [Gammaproteobacteria bacterium]
MSEEAGSGSPPPAGRTERDEAETTRRRQVRSWVMFDFANSIYPAVMTTAVFPVFYVSTVVGGEGGEGELWWGSAVSLSVLMVALSAPLLGGIADRCGLRKRFLAVYVAVCLVGVSLLTTVGPGMVFAGFAFFVVANIGFEGGLVFYNAYLSDITPPEERGAVSGYGFGWGYLGSALGLILALVFLQALFVDQIEPVWLLVVGFFLVFSIPAFRHLPPDRGSDVSVGEAAVLGTRGFLATLREVWALRDLRRFLTSYFFYIDGINTVIVMAAVIATETFGFNQTEAIILFLVVQFSAMAGALTLAKPTDRLGPRRILTGVLIMWVVAGVAAYFVQSTAVFYGLAVVAGLGLGSVQSASRAYLTLLIPQGREAEMFGFYAFCGKTSSVLGPVLFGWATFLAAGNQRPGFLVLTALMLTGLLLLRRVPDPLVHGGS